MWEPQVSPLVAAGYRVVRCDLRGYGDSPLPPGRFSNVEDVRALLDELAIDGATVVGASFGGRVALELTLEHPERVEALVLVGPGLRGIQWSENIERFGDEEEALLDAGDVEAAVELNVRTWVDGPARGPDEVDRGVRDLVATMQRRAFEVQVAVPDAGPDEEPERPAADRLGDVRCPTLVVVGDFDQPDILKVVDELAAAIPRARREIIGGAAHLPSLEKPEQFNALLLEFLRVA